MCILTNPHTHIHPLVMMDELNLIILRTCSKPCATLPHLVWPRASVALPSFGIAAFVSNMSCQSLKSMVL